MAELRCPICDAPIDTESNPALPFCSARCRKIDLSRWLNEDYGLPIEPERDEPEEFDDERN